MPGSQAAGPRDVFIWYRMTHRLDERAVLDADATLSAEERARRDRFRFAEDRRDYAIAHDLLRRSLSACSAVAPTGWRFGVSARGKPFIEAPRLAHPLSFNLSHTRGAVACAVTGIGEVGVDVERVHRGIDALSLARSYFSAREILLMHRARSDAAVRWAELWTLKEAFLKATGAGLSQPLDAMSFELDDDGTIGFAPPPGVDATRWDFALFAPVEEMRIASAVERRAGPTARFIVREVAGAAPDPHHPEPDPSTTVPA